MRRVRFIPAVAVLAAFSAIPVGGPALAAPSPSATSADGAAAGGPKAAPGVTVCSITTHVFGLSGLVATSSGYVVINDSQATRSDTKIFKFDSACKAQGTPIAYPGDGPYDPEDLAMAKDGTLWIADTGDNPASSGGSGKRRETIALWSLAPGANQKPVIHRFVYPDPPHNAEALLIADDGTPIIITRQDESNDTNKFGTPAKLYVPAAPIQANNAAGVALKLAGEVKIPKTSTSNPVGLVGRGVVTGAAMSPDRTRVALRTYADAFEWDVAGGDVLGALTKGTPRITPLPDEPMGEAIAYSADGKSLLTTIDNETASSKMSTPILRYAPASAAAPAAAKTPGNGAGAPKEASWWGNLTVQDKLVYAVALLGVLGLLLVVAGLLGIRRSRQLRRTGSARAKGAMPAPARDEDLPGAGDERNSGAIRDDRNSGAIRDERSSGAIRDERDSGPIRDDRNSGAIRDDRQRGQTGGTVYGRGPDVGPDPEPGPGPRGRRQRRGGPWDDHERGYSDDRETHDDGYSQAPGGGWR